MPKDNTFTVPQVPGSSRKSPRNYTHAVIGERNYDLDIKSFSSPEFLKHHAKEFKFWVENSKAIAGQKPSNGYSYTITQEMIDRGKEQVEKYGTGENYAKTISDLKVARLQETKAKNAGTPSVLQWSQSFENASKKVGSWSQCYINVKVVPTVLLRAKTVETPQVKPFDINVNSDPSN